MTPADRAELLAAVLVERYGPLEALLAEGRRGGVAIGSQGRKVVTSPRKRNDRTRHRQVRPAVSTTTREEGSLRHV